MGEQGELGNQSLEAHEVSDEGRTSNHGCLFSRREKEESTMVDSPQKRRVANWQLFSNSYPLVTLPFYKNGTSTIVDFLLKESRMGNSSDNTYPWAPYTEICRRALTADLQTRSI
jgi:hypothetical protein